MYQPSNNLLTSEAGTLYFIEDMHRTIPANTCCLSLENPDTDYEKRVELKKANPVNCGHKRLSPHRVRKRRTRNKAARKARQR